MKNTINCQICGAELKRVTRSHLKKHGITTARYKSIFPYAPIVSEMLAHQLGKASREMTEERKKQVKETLLPYTKKPKSEAHRAKLSEYRKGRSWGCHTEEHKEKMKIVSKLNMDKRIAEGWRPPEISNESRKKLSDKIKKIRAEKYWRGPTNKGKQLNLSDEQRANRSRKRVNYLANNPTPKTNTSLEKEMKKYLENENINYAHQFKLCSQKGNFLFDFYIPEKNLLLEMDGEYWHAKNLEQINRDKLKERLCKELGYNFLRISDKDWKPNLIHASLAEQEQNNRKILESRFAKFGD